MQRNRWMPGYAPAEHGVVLVLCFPFAGGAASTFRDWRTSNHPGVRFQPIELPGRASRLGEAAFSRVGDLIDSFLEACAPELSHQDYALFGHSMGGAICARLAGVVAARGLKPPKRLFISGAAPQLRKASKPLHALSDDALISKLREFGGSPPEVLANASLMELLLPTLRSDFALLDDCPAPGPLAQPVTVFSGTHDTLASPHDSRRWSTFAPAGFRQVVLPGDHFFVHSQGGRLRQEIAKELRADGRLADNPVEPHQG